MKFFTGILLGLVVLILELELVCNAAETWQTLKESADRLQQDQQYGAAAESYKRVLGLVPKNELEIKTKVEVLIAVNMIKLRKYEEAVAHGNTIVALCTELNAKQKITPEVKANVIMLTMFCNAPDVDKKLPYGERHALAQRFTQLRIALKEAMGGKATSDFGAHMDVARGFVALSKDDEAEKELQKIADLIKDSKAPNSTVVRSAIAGIKKKHGDPAMSTKLLAELRQRFSEPEALKQIGAGEFWAADYEAAKLTLEKARKSLDKAKPGERNTLEVEILTINAKLRSDAGQNAAAEPYLRQALALGQKYHLEKIELAAIERLLLKCLKEQNRTSDAKSVKEQMSKTRGPKGHLLILSDKERSLLRKKVDNQQK